MAVFNWVKNKQFDVMLLQETYSAQTDENLWQSEWGGPAFWSHGSKHSSGVSVLVRKGFDLNPTEIIIDPNGKYIIVKALVQGETIYIINLYAPNSEHDKALFFKHLHNEITQIGITDNDCVIVGGDWNTIMSSDLDKAGGVIKTRETITKEMKSFLMALGLVDIWRIKNPSSKRFTFRQRRPLIQSRLDYFMISSCLSDLVEQAQIMSSFCSDHSCIALKISPLPRQERGPGYWKFNASLISDDNYVEKLNNSIKEWIEKYDHFVDKRLTWELLKYEIRRFTCKYAAVKKKTENFEEQNLDKRLNYLETLLSNNPGNYVNDEYHTCKERLKELEDKKANGAIIRSRVKWLEDGEKSTHYFYDLEKYNYTKKNVRKLELENGEKLTGNDQILSEAQKFYESLYTSQYNNVDNNDFFDNCNIPELNMKERESCDKVITEKECFENLKNFKNNKSPGNDGLTKEFYVAFWKAIYKPLLECYAYSEEQGMLSNSQRQALIVLLEKQGKDRCHLNNWRPISLLNVDYKLLTKVLAHRIKNVLPSIISQSQTGYVMNSSINDSVRLVQDIIHYTDLTQSPGVLLTVDFKKAFDSIEWAFVFKALTTFNFGPVLINWIRIIYTNISSCIYNNGKTSQYFNLHRGVRQGDPLSPYLFIIGMEILSWAIKQNNKIQGFQIKSQEIKVTLYADDLTIMLSDFNSVAETLNLLRKFRICSGLSINLDKTEGMLIGPWRRLRQDLPSNIKWTNGPIKLLGIYLSSDPNETIVLNFQSKIDALLRQLHWWKARDLTLTGRVLIVKSLALSKFQYLASLIKIPQNVIMQVNSIIYEFIWNGKTDKVKRKLFEQDYSKGGYKMINLNDIITSASAMWVKKILDSTDRAWKHTLEWFSKRKNLSIFLMSNFDASELPITMPPYYTETIYNWSQLTAQSTGSIISIKEQCLWYNKTLKVGGKSVYSDRLFSLGMWVVGDLFENEDIIPFDTWLHRGASELDRMIWYGIISCISKVWKIEDITNSVSIPPFTIPCGMYVNESFITIDEVKQRHIKVILANQKLCSLKANEYRFRIKHELIHGFIATEDWEQIFLVPRILPVDNKIKDLQYKIIMRFLPTNYLLYKMKKVNSQNCIFCNTEPETIEHLFFNCCYVKNIWWQVFDELHSVTGQRFSPTLQSCILGIYDNCDASQAINIVILLVKYYIMKSKYDSHSLSLGALAAMFKYKVELFSKVYRQDVLLHLSLMFSHNRFTTMR